MVPFNLTALTRKTPYFNEKQKPLRLSPGKPIRNFTQYSFKVSVFNLTSRVISKNIFVHHGTTINQKENNGRNDPCFLLEEDKEPMVTEPIKPFDRWKRIFNAQYNS